MPEPVKKTLKIRGKTENFEGVVTYTTVVEHNETNEQAAARGTQEYFMFRQGKMVSFEEVETVPDVKNLSGTDGFDTSNTLPNESAD